ncbi:jg24091 [Pararge aegeria aegeria]|uniref:Jg24091 protein n=1 Tax=Pararge aegeria aegeria TaxID=348720 RepID=A0A8S4QYJ8_9NEOP|nr:jg24091 [Pararge aegeria aegeria]
MPLKKIMKGLPKDKLPADGLMSSDLEVLTPCQVACTERLGNTLQLEQETYLLQHPEVKAMLELFICKMSQKNKRNGVLKEAAEYFTRPAEELDKEILERLNLLPEGFNTRGVNLPEPYADEMLMIDLRKLINTHNKPNSPMIPSPAETTYNTESSSFVSVKTSDTTLSTPGK